MKIQKIITLAVLLSVCSGFATAQIVSKSLRVLETPRTPYVKAKFISPTEGVQQLAGVRQVPATALGINATDITAIEDAVLKDDGSVDLNALEDAMLRASMVSVPVRDAHLLSANELRAQIERIFDEEGTMSDIQERIAKLVEDPAGSSKIETASLGGTSPMPVVPSEVTKLTLGSKVRWNENGPEVVYTGIPFDGKEESPSARVVPLSSLPTAVQRVLLTRTRALRDNPLALGEEPLNFGDEYSALLGRSRFYFYDPQMQQWMLHDNGVIKVDGEVAEGVTLKDSSDIYIPNWKGKNFLIFHPTDDGRIVYMGVKEATKDMEWIF